MSCFYQYKHDQSGASEISKFMVRPTSSSSLPVVETLCLTSCPIADQYILQTKLLRSLLYPEEGEITINETSVEKLLA